jgi:hypothetical protein
MYQGRSVEGGDEVLHDENLCDDEVIELNLDLKRIKRNRVNQVQNDER